MLQGEYAVALQSEGILSDGVPQHQGAFRCGRLGLQRIFNKVPKRLIAVQGPFWCKLLIFVRVILYLEIK